ncbi:MAG: glycosyl hydrolase [Acidobacteriota bacterium]
MARISTVAAVLVTVSWTMLAQTAPPSPPAGAPQAGAAARPAAPAAARPQPKSASPTAPAPAGAEKPAKPPTLSDQFPGLEFRNIGPFRGGRSVAVTGVRGKPQLFYFGGTGSGVWKTTDGGATWANVSDTFFKTGSVGAIAVAASDANVLYVGTGETAIRGSTSSHGDGVYKSTDAGATWTNVGLADTRQIARVRIHPSNPDIAYVAAQGHIWGPNEARGIYRTLDGGKTWTKVLFVDDKTGASDLMMDPTNPRILYAAFWQVYRKPWTLQSGGPGGGLYKSLDGGDTWKKLAGGLPDLVVGKVTVSVSASKPSRVWAMVEAEKGGLYRSDDGGEKWTLVNGSHRIRQRAWYYSGVFADPTNQDVVYLPNISFLKSVDGGKTFSSIRVRHGDTHDLWIDPEHPARMILGDDGGAEVTANGGETWTSQDTQPTAQIYRVTTDSRFPYWVYGSQQDNSSIAIPSGVRDSSITQAHWHAVAGGESGWIAPDPRNPDIVFAGGYGGSITRYDHKTGEQREIVAYPQVIDGRAARDLKYRFQWTAPILLSPHDPDTLYHAAQMLLRSRDAGQSWEEISPDLSRNDTSKQDYSGGPIAHEFTGVETYNTIFSVVESPHEAGTIWAGTDDGLVHLTRDAGKTWTNVTPKGIPEWIRINAIEVSPHDKATAYVAAMMNQHDDLRPYIYKTTDYGKTWTTIVKGIPDTTFARVVREDPARKGLLYAGTESGLYLSFDGGANWQRFQRNLPVVPITDLVVKYEDLVVATEGRAFWILDDLTALRQWQPEIVQTPARLFAPRPTFRLPGEVSLHAEGGKNRPSGVIVNFWLKDKPKADAPVTLEFLDGSTLLRTLSSVAPKVEDDLKEAGEEDDEDDKPIEPVAGVNRIVWDLRQTVASLVMPRYTYGDFPPQGVRITPGRYTVRLTVGETKLEAPFEVRPNPAVKASPEDLVAQANFLKSVRDDLTTIHGAIRRIKDVNAQTTGLMKRATALGKGGPLKEGTDRLMGRLNAIADELYNPKLKTNQDSLNYLPKLDFQFAGLAGVADTADAAPTSGIAARYRDLKSQLTDVMQRLQRIVDTDLSEVNKAIVAAGIPPIALVPFDKPLR